ncbi:cytochrome C oxidase subunit II, transmembrane domain-containing protein [Haematococcus lacustris]
MLRHAGVFALRAMKQQQAGGKALSAAAAGSRAPAAAIGEATTEAIAGGAQATFPQYSSSAAAALANKRADLVGNASLKLVPGGKGFTTFASSSSSAPAAVAAAAQAAEEQPSFLRRILQGVTILVGAMALAATTAAADAPEAWQWLFQDMATSTGQAAVDLHHDIMFFLITVIVLVFYLLAQISTKFHYSRQLKPEKLTHHTTLEVIWTIIPTFIVLSIAVPSLTLIYSLDQHNDRPGLTVKVIGRQWYWSYEMHDHLQQKLLDPDRLVAIAEKSVLKA